MSFSIIPPQYNELEIRNLGRETEKCQKYEETHQMIEREVSEDFGD